MKNKIAVILGLFLFTAGMGFPVTPEQDIKGSKDHPLLSRMPDFHISDYKASEFGSARLKSYGVASLSPVASNDNEEGRAKNRRVELVKQ